MAVTDCIDDRSQRFCRLLLCKVLHFHDFFEELSAAHELHDQVVEIGVFKYFIELNYVRMINVCKDIYFILKAEDFLLAQLRFLDYFDSHLFSSLFISSF